MNRILRTKEIQTLLGLSRTTLWRIERKDPTFPRRIRLSANSVGWDAEELAQWLASRPRGFTNAQAAEPPSTRKAG